MSERCAIYVLHAQRRTGSLMTSAADQPAAQQTHALIDTLPAPNASLSLLKAELRRLDPFLPIALPPPTDKQRQDAQRAQHAQRVHGNTVKQRMQQLQELRDATTAALEHLPSRPLNPSSLIPDGAQHAAQHTQHAQHAQQHLQPDTTPQQQQQQQHKEELQSPALTRKGAPVAGSHNSSSSSARAGAFEAPLPASSHTGAALSRDEKCNTPSRPRQQSNALRQLQLLQQKGNQLFSSHS